MLVKICGIRSRAEAVAAAEAGAAYVGLVFFDRSPRRVSIADARWVAEGTPEGVRRVALTVDASDAEIEAILSEAPIDMLQLHGAETPERVSAVRQRFRLPVMKAVAIEDEDDLAALRAYGQVADQLLVDARAPAGAELPGGNGRAFDWRLIAGWRWATPWMLAGGLTPENVGEAVRQSGAVQVDVSSGVESSPGFKDVSRVAAFVEAANSADRVEGAVV